MTATAQTEVERTAQAWMTASARATRMWCNPAHSPAEQRAACWEAECAKQQAMNAAGVN